MLNNFLLVICCLFFQSIYSIDRNTTSFIPQTFCSSTECYVTEKQIGEGAFGKVYIVKNTKGESFALKLYKNKFNSSYSSSANYLYDPRREFAIGQRLDHPNIVKTFEFFSDQGNDEDNSHCLILELIEGKTLHDLTKNSFTKKEGLKATLQFLDAIQYTLASQLLYIDLHAGNILLDPSGHLAMIDLASFFSLEEMFSYLSSHDSSTSFNSITHSLKTFTTSKHPFIMTKEDKKFNLAKEIKIHNFFIENPKLLKQLNELRNRDSPASSKTLSNKNSYKAEFHAYSPHYFDSITTMCIKILAKSGYHREERLEIRTAIKKLVWTYEEDLEEELQVSVDDYLEDLKILLYQRLANE